MYEDLKDKPRFMESLTAKMCVSKNYNYIYAKIPGTFIRWGKTKDDDPEYSPFGPEIADIEISTVCHGIGGKPCKFCYKSNTGNGKNMSFETFEKIFKNLPPTVTQIAFGIGDLDANPDLFKIFEHCRKRGVIPNVTINGDRLSEFYTKKISYLCGAVAVSRYSPPDVCYDAVEALTKEGMQQVNIHKLLSEETYEECLETIEDAAQDPRLEKMKAVVFLALKPQGRGKVLTPMRDPKRYRKLVDLSIDKHVNIGFDSCTAPMFLKAMEGHKNYSLFEQMAEPCESTLFSLYIDVDGFMHPCSFLESTDGINMLECSNFLEDVWFNEKAVKFRDVLLNTAKSSKCLVKGCRQCPAFDIY
jgi:MoaA/NifB/PqqE/SkfB family radical SAM enzyme